MLGAKVDVKGHKLPHHAALGQAIPKILDGVDRWQEVGAGRMQRYADRRIPPETEAKPAWHSPSGESQVYYRSSRGIKLSRKV